jgi:serine/threonine protein kinase
MTPEQIERVFGLGRLKMATGEHVEVFREAVAPGERRRYTKRFLATSDADFGQWTEREWRILARLIGHGIRCVPDVVQFDGGAMGGTRLVQTYDAGVTVDQWATLLPVSRDGAVRRHVFEDCAHWWALAHYCLAALDEIHSLQLVHLDFKGDNICIPYGPANFDPDASARLYPIFQRLALIDFAFSLVSRENLSTPLPIGWQKDYDYQSPRLLRALDAGRNGDLQPTKELDWRCDLYSLAAMLKRYLPSENPGGETGWTPERFDDARTLIFRVRECHDRDNPDWRPHQQLMDFAGARLAKVDLAASLNYGWVLARAATTDGAASPITPMTRIAPSIRAAEPIRIAPFIQAAEPIRISTPIMIPTAVTAVRGGARIPAQRRRLWTATVLAPAIVALAALAAPSFIGDPEHPLVDRARAALDVMRLMFQAPPDSAIAAADAPVAKPVPPTDPERTAPSPDSTPTPIAAPAVIASSAPNDERAEPDAKPASPIADQKALSSGVANARAKPGTPVYRPQVAPSPPQSTSVTPRPAHPLPRLASTPSPKPTRGPSIASARASGHSSPQQASIQQQRFLPPRPPVQVAAARPAPPRTDSRAQAAPPATEPPASDPAPDQRSPQPVAANQSAAGDPTDTITGDRRTPTAATAAPSGGVAQTPNEGRRAPSTATNQPQSVQNPKPPNEWRTLLTNLAKLLRRRDEPPAPVAELSIQPTAPQLAAARPPVRSPPNLRAQASAQQTESPHVSPALAPTERLRAEGSPSIATSPMLIADARAQITPSEIPARPTPASQPMVEPIARSQDRSQDALVMQARRMLTDTVPRVATRAEPDVSRVLGLAAVASHPSQQHAVVDAIYAKWPSETGWTAETDIEPIRARRLHEDARQAFTSGRVSDAVNIQLSAFGANPRDPEIAAYLAFLYLRMSPAQPEVARQLALYAISVSGSRRSARSGDWGTLAIASALAGRNIEATRAFFVEVALTSNLDRTCQTALSAYHSFGERLRVPVHAMLDRIDSSDRVSPYCEWPRTWNTAMRW